MALQTALRKPDAAPAVEAEAPGLDPRSPVAPGVPGSRRGDQPAGAPGTPVTGAAPDATVGAEAILRRIRADRVLAMRHAIRLDGAWNPVLSGLAVALLHWFQLASLDFLLVWAAAMTLIGLAGSAWAYAVRRHPPASDAANGEEWRLAVYGAVAAAGWAVPAAALAPHGPASAVVIVALVTAGMNFGVIANFVVSGRALALGFAALNLPLVGAMMLAGDAIVQFAGGLLTLGMLMVLPSAAQLNRQFNETIRLKIEREQLVGELRGMVRRADDANVTKSQFLANISHELRTPLNAVIGFAELMNEQVLGPLDDRYRQYAKDIHDSGVHLLSVINDILDLAKVEADNLDLSEDAIDISRMWEECRRMMGDRAEAGEIVLGGRIEAGLPKLLGDTRRIRQVVINLLSNAIKFTPPKGDVVFRARIVAGGWLTLSVSDTGVGMAPEDIPRALAPFQQIDQSLSRRRQGTGLGLSLSKRIVELHDGDLAISSAPGIGTTVTLRFPPSRQLPVILSRGQ